MTIPILAVVAVLARVTGLFLTAPVLGSAAIPRVVRGVLVLGLGGATLAMLPPAMLAGGTPGILELCVVAAGECAIGAVIGFIATLPLIAAAVGGSLMGQQMGIALPAMLDPGVGVESDDMGRAFLLLAIVCFVVVGGLEQVFSAVLGSFGHLPVAGLAHESLATMAAGMLDACFEFGLRVALPLLGVLMLQAFVLALIARSMPQLNIFSIGLPLRVLVGLVVLVAGLAAIAGGIETFIPAVLDQLGGWATGGVT